jgi:hypothetical protein
MHAENGPHRVGRSRHRCIVLRGAPTPVRSADATTSRHQLDRRRRHHGGAAGRLRRIGHREGADTKRHLVAGVLAERDQDRQLRIPPRHAHGQRRCSRRRHERRQHRSYLHRERREELRHGVDRSREVEPGEQPEAWTLPLPLLDPLLHARDARRPMTQARSRAGRAEPPAPPAPALPSLRARAVS